MLDGIYPKVMKTIYERSHRNHKSNFIVDVQLAKFNKRYRNSKRFYITLSSNGVFQVQIPDSGTQYVVDLRKKTCDCTHFSEYQSPCSHTIAAC
jgi:hypothetical protein